MRTKFDPDKVVADASQIVKVWEANSDFKMKDVTLDDLKVAQANLEKLLAEIGKKEDDLTGLRNDRDDEAVKLNEICTRARSGIRGFYGPDSTQYEQVGGTRASERKKPRRRAKDTPSK